MLVIILFEWLGLEFGGCWYLLFIINVEWFKLWYIFIGWMYFYFDYDWMVEFGE